MKFNFGNMQQLGRKFLGNTDLTRSLGLGLLSAQTGPSKTPMTFWQTAGPGLAAGYNLYNNKKAQRLKELQALGELQMKHAVSKQLGIPVSPASRALEASLSKRVGLPVGGQAQTPKTSEQDLEFLRGRASQPLPGSSAEFPISEATFASNPMAAPNPSVSLGDPASEYFSAKPRPTTQPTSAIGGSPNSPTLDAYKLEVRKNALAKMAGIPYMLPTKPETTTLYSKDSGRPLTVAQADAQQIIDTGEWLTYNPYKKPGVTVKMPDGPPVYTPLEKKMAERSAVYVETVNNEATEANAQQQKLDLLERVLTGQKTGRGMPTLRELQGVADTFGIQIGSKKGLTSYQASESIVAELALRARNPESGLGLTGNTSERDLEFLRSLPPSAGKTPEANAILFMAYRKLAARKNKIADAVNRLTDDGKLSYKDRAEIRAIEVEPIFTEEDWNELERVRASDSGGGDQQASQDTAGSPSDTVTLQEINTIVDIYAPPTSVRGNNMGKWNGN